MQNIVATLKRLYDLGISLKVSSGQLEISDPKGNLTQELLVFLKANKPGVIETIENFNSGSTFTAIEKASKREHYALSSAQQRIFLHTILNKQSLAYNISYTTLIEGKLDIDRLSTVFEQLVDRHDSFRTSFDVVNDQPVQRVHDHCAIKVERYQSTPEGAQAILDDFIRPFDLSVAPLLRVGLVDIGEEKRLLIVDTHHIISDGVSRGILINDFLKLYQGESLPPLTLSYTDYSEWQQSPSRAEDIAKDKAFWLKEFESLPTPIDLPADYRPGKERSYAGAVIHFELDEVTTRGLKALAQSHGASLFIVLLSLYYVLLAKLSKSEDVVIGTATSGRDHYDVKDIVGMFINMLALRSFPTSEKSFSAFLEEVRSKVLESFDHQFYQYEELLTDLKLERKEALDPLLDAVFSYTDFDGGEINLPGLSLKPYENKVAYTTKFDLLLIAQRSEDKVALQFEYSTELFSKETIDRFTTYYQRIAASVISDAEVELSKIEILSPAERTQLLEDFNATEVQYPVGKTVLDLFEEQAAKMADKTALVHKKQQISYGTLNEKANQLANHLKSMGLQSDDVVGVMLNRSPELVISLLAIMKSGGAYLALDANNPASRNEKVLTDSKASLLITGPDHSGFSEGITIIDVQDAAIDLCSSEFAPVSISQSNLAYLIYTSGSTGTPKGVKIAHKAFYNYISWASNAYIKEESCNMALFTSVAFDLTLTSIFLPLVTGNTLYTYEEELHESLIHRVIRDGVADVVKLTPTHLKLLCESKDIDFKGVKRLILGGEQFEADLAVKAYERSGGTLEIFNEYGPTEATVGCMLYQYAHDQRSQKIVSIGYPAPNNEIYILDENMGLVPEGVPGEIYIGGAQLFSGYHGLEKETSNSLVDHPFKHGEKLYKTGDVGRHLTSGVSYLGRKDEQIKLRGFRIEPGEIEHRMRQHQLVGEAAITLYDGATNQYLIGYYQAAQEVDQESIRGFLSEQLPDYMIPSFFVHLETFPISASGKLDRKALPAPKLDQTTYIAPANELESQIVKIWAAVLSLEVQEISTNSNFFQLGGNSLGLIAISGRIGEALDVSLSPGEVFANASVRQLASHIQSNMDLKTTAIPKVEDKPYYKISPAQFGIYFAWESNKSSLNYNVPYSWLLEGEINKHQLITVFQSLIERHAALRTHFELIDHDVVQVIEEDPTLNFEEFDLDAGNPDQIMADFIRPFDLGDSSLLRVGLVRLSEKEHILMVDMHHIISDGVSRGILINDFVELFKGKELPPIRLSYKDYSEWQQSPDRVTEIAADKDFWLKEFEVLPDPIELPGQKRPGKERDFKGGVVSFQLDEATTQALTSLAQSQGASLFMVLLSIYNVLLAKLSNKEDVVIGSVTAGRDHHELKDIVGIFVNMLALRNYPSPDKTFNGFLEEVKAKTMESIDHQSYQYEELITALKADREDTLNPLLDAVFSFSDFAEEEFILPGLNMKPYEGKVTHTTKFDFLLMATLSEEKLYLNFEYSIDRFDEATIALFPNYFQQIVKSVVDSPDQKLSDLTLMTIEERTYFLEDFNDTTFAFPPGLTVLDMFEDQVSQNPKGVALRLGDATMTYAEVAQKSQDLCHALIAHGLGDNQLVGILLERSESLIIALLAVLKTGKGFVALDPSYPMARKEHIFKDSEVEVVLSTMDLIGDHLEALQHIPLENLIDVDMVEPASTSDMPELPAVDQESLAYVLYTSGSTGTPKGAMIAHKALYNYVSWASANYIKEQHCHMPLFSSVAFDLTMTSIFLPLVTGNTLVIYDEEPHKPVIQRVVREGLIDVIKLTPTHLKMLCETNDADFTGIKRVIVGGEQFESDLAAKVCEQSGGTVEIFNEYGPTEATVGCMLYQYNHDEIHQKDVSIGHPAPNNEIYILDEKMALVPKGVPGEIYIGGEQLFNGYHGLEKETSRSLVDHPFRSGEKLYKTGDLGRHLVSGGVAFIGRKDEQIKLRGYRIELGEIEYSLRQHTLIDEAVVTFHNGASNQYLIGYYKSAEAVDHTALRNFLAEHLPEYMIPGFFVHMEAFPVTTNGKLDKKALPDPEMDQTKYIPASNERESTIIKIWAEVLNLKEQEISINSNFFELGGNSINVLSFISKLNVALDQDLLVTDVFKYVTVKKLAAFLANKAEATEASTKEELPSYEEEETIDSLFSKFQ